MDFGYFDLIMCGIFIFLFYTVESALLRSIAFGGVAVFSLHLAVVVASRIVEE